MGCRVTPSSPHTARRSAAALPGVARPGNAAPRTHFLYFKTISQTSQFQLVKKLCFSAELFTNRSFGPLRHARQSSSAASLCTPRHRPCGTPRGILNEKASSHKGTALGAASAQEALQRSGTRLRAQQPPIFSAFAARPALCLAKMRGFPPPAFPGRFFPPCFFYRLNSSLIIQAPGERTVKSRPSRTNASTSHTRAAVSMVKYSSGSSTGSSFRRSPI